jgi:hypothetical protein
MDMYEALRARILAAAPVAALAGSRVSWVERPQSGALPAVTLQVISGANETVYAGNQQTQSERVQVDTWTTKYADAAVLAKAVTDAVEPPHTGNGIRFDRSFLESKTDLGEDTGKGFVHRRSLDFIIWYAET